MCRPGVPVQDADNGRRSTTKLRPARLQFGVKGQTNKKDLKQDECEGLMCPLTFAHMPWHVYVLHTHATVHICPSHTRHHTYMPLHTHTVACICAYTHTMAHTCPYTHATTRTCPLHTHTHAMARICPYTQTHQEINILKARRVSCSVFPFQKNKK